MQRHKMQGYVWHFAATFSKFAIYYIFFLLLLFNVFCLQLAPVPERARLSSPLIPLLGERVGVKEREQGWARDTETEREDKE